MRYDKALNARIMKIFVCFLYVRVCSTHIKFNMQIISDYLPRGRTQKAFCILLEYLITYNSLGEKKNEPFLRV